MNWRQLYRPVAGSLGAGAAPRTGVAWRVRAAARALEGMGLCRWETEGGALAEEKASAVRRHAFPRDPRGSR